MRPWTLYFLPYAFVSWYLRRRTRPVHTFHVGDSKYGVLPIAMRPVRYDAANYQVEWIATKEPR